MASPGTPDWWLDRLYKRLRDRQPQIRAWDDWYTGNHPLPQGYEKAGEMLMRLLETIGLNMMPVVTDAALDRLFVEGFKVNGKTNDAVWEMLQSNRFDLSALQVLQESMALSEAYMLVDPNENREGFPTVTPEHPEQAITEDLPGSMTRAAGLKVWQDDLGDSPLIWAMVYLPDRVEAYAAPTRIYAQASNRSALALKPMWEYQESMSGANPLGEVPLVPFSNRPRMLKAPEPEFAAAIRPQRRINKTLMDRMAMQDQGAFKAMWASGLSIPRDPATGKPVEDFVKAIDRMFINENPAGKFGQLEAEDIKQMLEAVRDDVADCAMVVPTSPDAILGKLVNVSGDGLKLAQVSEVKRVRRHMTFDGESFEEVARLTLKAAGKDVARVSSMTTTWRNPEYRTEGEMSDAATKAIANGMSHEAAWARYYGATPDEIRDWRKTLDAQALSPGARAILSGKVGAPNADLGA